jgi:hypothetical protein
MNAFDYAKEIEGLRLAFATIQGVAIKISDSQNQMSNSGDIVNAQSDITCLMLAAWLVSKTLPGPRPRLRPAAQIALNCLLRIPNPDAAELIAIKDLQLALNANLEDFQLL